ncbi:MAG: hypothetical protein IJW54_01790 [Clostridia bacterium]|nr:hypothetical protein [Clostridia bacterium]
MKQKNPLHVFINPPKAIKILTILLTPLLVALSIVVLATNLQETNLFILAYLSYGLSACFLAYSVFLIVKNRKKIRERVANFVENNDVAYVLVKDLGYRSVFIACFSLLFGIVYSIINGVMAALSMSVWYLSLAIYYIALVIIRGAILIYQKKKLQGRNNNLSSIKTYRNAGIALLLIHVAITVAVLQMILINKFFEYPGLLIYTAATYAFLKITLSVINIIKVKKQKDYTIKALLCINLADAVISILALQTAMLNTFGQGGNYTTLANSLTGSAACLLTLALGIYMIIKGQKEIRQELNNGKK